MSKADYAVFVGRFQPIHKAHIKVIENALQKEAGRLIIVVGSYRAPLSLKNPWTFEERKNLILNSLPAEWHDRISIVPLRDFLYQETNWVVGLQNAVRQVVSDPEARIKLVGHFKDDSSYYLNSFPQWTLVREPNHFGLNSRDIRKQFFELDSKFNPDNERGTEWDRTCKYSVSDYVAAFLNEFRSTDRFKDLKREQEFLAKYKEQWAASPFPPTFVATDAVVVMSGHVLLVRRGRNPGKGCLALPGGFVKHDKSIFDSCMEELKEETEIVYPREKIKAFLKKEHVFDHPGRDSRGRTITHGFYFKLPTDELPHVKGGDDASEALWVPIADLGNLEDQFYSDHLHIINHFIFDGQ